LAERPVLGERVGDLEHLRRRAFAPRVPRLFLGVSAPSQGLAETARAVPVSPEFALRGDIVGRAERTALLDRSRCARAPRAFPCTCRQAGARCRAPRSTRRRRVLPGS
jgi:hypothetical protein